MLYLGLQTVKSPKPLHTNFVATLLLLSFVILRHNNKRWYMGATSTSQGLLQETKQAMYV